MDANKWNYNCSNINMLIKRTIIHKLKYTPITQYENLLKINYNWNISVSWKFYLGIKFYSRQCWIFVFIWSNSSLLMPIMVFVARSLFVVTMSIWCEVSWTEGDPATIILWDEVVDFFPKLHLPPIVEFTITFEVLLIFQWFWGNNEVVVSLTCHIV